MTDELKPGDYVGLYLDDKLIYTGVLKDIGNMNSGRMVYQILLVKNVFQRNFPEVHFSDNADVRPVSLDDVKAEIKQLKIRLQKHLGKIEPEHVMELIEEKELRSIIG